MNEKKVGVYLVLLTICLALLTFSIIYTANKINEFKEELKNNTMLIVKER